MTDGPYTEAKEVVGGYSIIDVSSREEAVALATRVIEIHRDYWPGWEGSAEVRPLHAPDLDGQRLEASRLEGGE